ncbi:aldolase/citrate lyase family protein [Kriegella aquimaris]|uniref:HpcH/HpaI aldolase/citrate lyase family protein n=1 Tax=Kriegella aquimaris TaxID=192904 RepID=A0A1G9IDS8_9FLAO|nr:aldolase/citrate lyase family protein [Kriegella aquimaris]SDL23367.1 HpcH/HpaI aldolase/citrate lyase family protein [Kriegella aquimaris]
MEVLYFIKYFSKGFTSYFKKISKSKAVFVFDIEDSIQDVSSEEGNHALKQKYRGILKALLNSYEEIYQNHRIGIRLNNVNSKEFEHDILLLEDLKKVHWETILIPKVEDRFEIEKVLSILYENKIKFNNIGIFAETRKGVSSLKEIIEPVTPELKYVIFGHADFNIDSNVFPFIHHDDVTYWKWVANILYHMKGSNLTFVNSPCLYLGDEELFNFTLDQLHFMCKEKYGQMTLNYKQTEWCDQYIPRKPRITSFSTIERDPITFAKYIFDSLECTKDTDKGFGIDEKGYLMSPHEILMAQRVLASNDS